MTRILITGIAGFAGSHLADYLLSDSTIDIVGIHHPSHPAQTGWKHDRLRIQHLDVLDAPALEQAVVEAEPDIIYHLAGLAHVHESWSARLATIQTNFLGSFYLLEACRKLPNFPKVLLVGSGECYGIVAEADQPIHEDRPLIPAPPYAVSKIAQEMLGMQYGRVEQYPVYISRPFNHTGPRQKETFVCSAMAMQIAMAELGLAEPEIHVGNLSAKRDFTDVRDVVAGYCAIVEKGKTGDPYNVCSGSACSIEEILHMLLSHARTKLKIVVDPERFRPVDMPLLLGSADKLQKDTGWKPRYSISETLLDLLNYWRTKLKGEA